MGAQRCKCDKRMEFEQHHCCKCGHDTAEAMVSPSTMATAMAIARYEAGRHARRRTRRRRR